MPHGRYTVQPALTSKLHRLSRKKEHSKFLKKSLPALATVLIDTMIEQNGFLPKERYYGSKYEITGLNYSDWIVGLKRAGILESFSNERGDKASWIRFRSGPVLAKYVNQQLTMQDQLATKRDVDELERKIDQRIRELDNRINKLQEEVRILTAPPPDAARQQKAHELTKQMIVLANERTELVQS